MSMEDSDIPQYLTDAYKHQVEVTLYGYHALTVGNRSYAPPVLTRKEKIKRKIAHKKWEIGRYLSDRANDLGYYDDRD